MIWNTPAPLNGYEKKVKILAWSIQSPNLDLIEILWHDLKQADHC